MFANIFSNKNVDNRFALYIDRNVNRLRSDIYPSVDVDIDVNDTVLHDVLRRVSKNEESENERNLSGINSIRREQLVDYYGEPVYNVDGIYDKYENIKIAPKSYNEKTGTLDDVSKQDTYNSLLHELRHHIDDELTPDTWNKTDSDFEEFAYTPVDYLKAVEDELLTRPDLHKNIEDDRDIIILDRLRFANELKRQTTPTYKQLEEYAN